MIEIRDRGGKEEIGTGDCRMLHRVRECFHESMTLKCFNISKFLYMSTFSVSVMACMIVENPRS